MAKRTGSAPAGRRSLRVGLGALTAVLLAAGAAANERPACMDLPWTCGPRPERMRLMPVRGCVDVEAERYRRTALWRAELDRRPFTGRAGAVWLIGYAQGLQLDAWQRRYGRCLKTLAWGYPRPAGRGGR